MTAQEKFEAVRQYAPNLARKDDDPTYLSMIVIMGYMRWLRDHNVIEDGMWQLSSTGEKLLSICEEFDWKPSIDDIVAFVSEFVEEEHKLKIAKLLMVLRDDDERFKKFVVDSQKPQL